MLSDGDVVWTVMEGSEAGETLVGVYTTLEAARSVVASLAGGRLEDYRIEGHALDRDREDTPWQVVLGRDGEHIETLPFIGCSCADDEAEYYKRSFIAEGGERMSVIVFARTPGTAIATARQYHRWLQEQGLWRDHAQPLQPLQAAAI